MVRKSVFLLLVSLQLFTSCSLIKIHPDQPRNGDVTVTWDKEDEDRVVVKDNTQKALLTEINTWLGTPYSYAQSVKGEGTDCSGMVMEVYRKVFGIKLNRSAEGQVANTVEIQKKDLRIGDLVFFITRGTRISHVGIYIGNNKFAHATTQRGVIISDLDEKYYQEHYSRSGRVIR